MSITRAQLTLIAALCTMLLTACSDEEAVSENTFTGSTANERKKQDRMQAVQLSIRGSEKLDWNYSGMYSCSEGRRNIVSFSQAPKLNISIPMDIGAGKVPMSDWNASTMQGAMMYLVGAITDDRVAAGKTYGISYTKFRSGDFVIENLPTKRGEYFVATFEGEMESSSGEIASIRLDLNVEDSGYCQN